MDKTSSIHYSSHLTLFFLLIIIDITQGVCPHNWHSHGGSCFLYINQTSNYTQATRDCQQLSGAHLVHVTSDDVHDFIQSLFSGSGWLGLRRSASGVWQWTDGAAIGYKNWEDQETAHDCAIVSTSGWRRRDCSSYASYVCQLKAGSGSSSSPPGSTFTSVLPTVPGATPPVGSTSTSPVIATTPVVPTRSSAISTISSTISTAPTPSRTVSSLPVVTSTKSSTTTRTSSTSTPLRMTSSVLSSSSLSSSSSSSSSTSGQTTRSTQRPHYVGKSDDSNKSLIMRYSIIGAVSGFVVVVLLVILIVCLCGIKRSERPGIEPSQSNDALFYYQQQESGSLYGTEFTNPAVKPNSVFMQQPQNTSTPAGQGDSGSKGSGSDLSTGKGEQLRQGKAYESVVIIKLEDNSKKV